MILNVFLRRHLMCGKGCVIYKKIYLIWTFRL